MKKFFTLSFMLLLGAASLFAQKNTDVKFVTIDEEGNKTGDVEDGAVITASTISDDGFNDANIPTGLGMENTTDGGKRVQVDYEILRLDNGGVQCCFSTCNKNYALGTYYTPLLSAKGNRINLPVIKKHDVNDLSGEWFYTGDGVATVKFTIKIGTKNTSKTDDEGEVYDVVEGPSVTVNFVKGAAGISSSVASAAASAKTTYFDLTGRRVSAPAQGVYVLRQVLSDGTVKTRKVMVK